MSSSIIVFIAFLILILLGGAKAINGLHISSVLNDDEHDDDEDDVGSRQNNRIKNLQHHQELLPQIHHHDNDDDVSIASQRRLASSTGTQTVLVVLVSSTAGERDSTLNTTFLQGTVFGIGKYAQSTNLISQYASCSHGMLQFKPASSSSSTIQNGVMELKITGKIAGGDIQAGLQKTILGAMKAKLQISDIRKVANHVMFCLPKGALSAGSSNWVSFGYPRGATSWYQNGACAMLSPMMHENGHNLGFYHSGLGTDPYGDTSGYMGYGYHQLGSPKMCFNAHKNWISGWFEDCKVTVNPAAADGGAWLGNVTSFVDYSSKASAANNIYHVVNVGNLYLQLNSAKKFNIGTRAHPNQVTIVKASSAYDISWLVAGLSTGQSYSSPGSGASAAITIKVCRIHLGARTGASTSTDADYALVTIFLNNGVQKPKCP